MTIRHCFSQRVYVLGLFAMLLMCGCSGLLYHFTEHAKCVRRCEDLYREAGEVGSKILCKDRCHREFGQDAPEEERKWLPRTQ